MVDVVEDQVDELAAPGEEQALRLAVLRYSREVAFAAAEVYAQAAESRGAWDARLEALVVDAVLRGEADDALQSRAAALGWDAQTDVVVVAGEAAAGLGGRGGGVAAAARPPPRRGRAGGGAGRPAGRRPRRRRRPDGHGGRAVRSRSPTGRSWSGPTVPHLFAAGRSARAALAGLVAARAWPEAPRPVLADDLLPERVLAGDTPARRALVDRVYRRLQDARGSLLDTVSTYLETGGSLEASARILFVHPNTVRYRLRRAAETCGYDVMQPRDAHVVRMALALGRLSGSSRRAAAAGRRATSARMSPPTGAGADRRLTRFCRNPPNRGRKVGPRRQPIPAAPAGRVGTCSSSPALDRAPRPPASCAPGSSCRASRTG